MNIEKCVEVAHQETRNFSFCKEFYFKDTKVG